MTAEKENIAKSNKFAFDYLKRNHVQRVSYCLLPEKTFALIVWHQRQK
jgi:hypothetical protein